MVQSSAPDVAIIGAGIVGCAAAAFLAEAGRSVVVFERERVAAGASGRNQGIVQRPFDPLLGPLSEATVREYRALSAMDLGFRFPERASGLLLVARDVDVVAAEVALLEREVPALRPAFVDPQALRSLEPALAPELSACRIETGYPVPPAAATQAYAELAVRRGVRFRVGGPWRPWLDRSRALGVEQNGERVAAGRVLVAAGAWSHETTSASGIERTAIPIRPLWGVVATVNLADPPRHALEEIGVDAFVSGARDVDAIPSIFSLVTADGRSGVGATGLPERPDETAVAPLLLERGAVFVPELTSARVVATRACPRPICADGRPMLGVVPGVDGLYVAAGHGPWGISTGAGSARLVADILLGRAAAVPAAFAADRFAGPKDARSPGSGDDASRQSA